jgi:hypothetical protein
MNLNMRKYNVLAEAILVPLLLYNEYLGAAFLVKNRYEGGKEYIAKKILLGSLQ